MPNGIAKGCQAAKWSFCSCIKQYYYNNYYVKCKLSRDIKVLSELYYATQLPYEVETPSPCIPMVSALRVCAGLYLVWLVPCFIYICDRSCTLIGCGYMWH